jgi:hypothetical protein
MVVDDERLRVAVYRSFATTGVAPPTDALGADTADVRERLRRLAAARHLVLDDDDRVVMAHPFSAIPLGFAVDPGYTRREPAEAAAYFKQVGLEGPFWGL